MASFFRRKPEESPKPRRGFSAEELAAAFPTTAPADSTSNRVDEVASQSPAPTPAVDPAVQAAATSDTAAVPSSATEAPGSGAPTSTATATPAPGAAPATAAAAAAQTTATHAPARATAQATAATPAAGAAPASPIPHASALPTAAAPSPSPAAAASAPMSPDAIIAAMSAPRPKPEPAPAAASWRERLRGTGFARSLGGVFSRNPRLDDDLLDEIETALLTADVGVTASTALVEGMRKRMKAREFADANALLAALRTELVEMLKPVARPLEIDPAARPFVILTVGVNGVGKTTTIGKLAHRYKDEGHSLMLAAGDTFRAAAVAQLQAWGDRNDVQVIAQGQEADPAAVAFDALQAAKARGTTVLIADTAGRLHTQQGLMAELGKIRRVLAKVDPAAPHEVLMVVDGTTGQNAISQLRQFNAAVNVTGLVVTKLDGTAKGGVVFALAREFGIPIRYAGIGERPEDLRVFDAQAFVDALLPASLGSEGTATQ
ncbi:signal recognition particle-docking protein FtsY [Luteimonas sp. MHLX1A]|uniref:signal recognition particle-docking protein FtsY n=1 Tax=Alterluteimonas muca TaxID=2878684 RepID=UPI001E3D65FD|nr:signal recognition particle-docking protein FtsY [Luteimonas sp. MHLX1A]MCD9046244.1 signal recognition particle-docking protein FtsY [Luteimonas sp. MHLX1A]